MLSHARRHRLRSIMLLAAGGLVSAVVLGFFGGWLAVFDTLAQFRAHASVALVAVAPALFASRLPSAALAALATAALGLYSVMPFMLPATPSGESAAGAPRYTLLQMNLRYDAPDLGPALGLIARQTPDVVAAEEVTDEWRDAFGRLSAAYPYQFYCKAPFYRGDTAILSRRPFLEDETGRPPGKTICDERNKLSAKTIDFNGLSVTVGVQHLRWPWPASQPKMVDALEPVLAGLEDPLIVAGDFNSAPWTASVRRYAEASRTRVLAGIGATWIVQFLPPTLARYIGLPIDNVLVSDGVQVLRVETLPPTSSDHLPVLVTFTLRFALPEEPEVRSAGR